MGHGEQNGPWRKETGRLGPRESNEQRASPQRRQNRWQGGRGAAESGSLRVGEESRAYSQAESIAEAENVLDHSESLDRN
jgi:hypothetical protein